jgi:hypothetical protein
MKPSLLPSSKAPEHHGWPMIRSKSGVAISRQQSWADFGVEELAFEVRWVTEPGWLALDIEVPTLCTMATEVGGRCEFRAKADQPVDGGYFGSDALAFAAAGAPLAIHAAEMRHGRLCCFAFRGAAVDYLTAKEIAAVGRLPSRYMFKNEPIRTCAALLDGGHTRGDSAVRLADGIRFCRPARRRGGCLVKFYKSKAAPASSPVVPMQVLPAAPSNVVQEPQFHPCPELGCVNRHRFKGFGIEPVLR